MSQQQNTTNNTDGASPPRADATAQSERPQRPDLFICTGPSPTSQESLPTPVSFGTPATSVPPELCFFRPRSSPPGSPAGCGGVIRGGCDPWSPSFRCPASSHGLGEFDGHPGSYSPIQGWSPDGPGLFHVPAYHDEHASVYDGPPPTSSAPAPSLLSELEPLEASQFIELFVPRTLTQRDCDLENGSSSCSAYRYVIACPDCLEQSETSGDSEESDDDEDPEDTCTYDFHMEMERDYYVVLMAIYIVTFVNLSSAALSR